MIDMSTRRTRFLQYLQVLGCLFSCAADLCNWTGSGPGGSALFRSVQQVQLRCSAGSVTWFSPRHALRVVLQPNVWSTHHATLCIKALRGFQGITVYMERFGRLDLLLWDELSSEVLCFRTGGNRVVLFLQASPLSSGRISTVGFRYELLHRNTTVAEIRSTSKRAVCGPCSDSEVLNAICSSDFVVRGSIKNITHDSKRQLSVIEVEEGRVFRQRSGVFERELHTSGRWRGNIRTLLQCAVKAGPGDFLFTGTELFGEAWLGCAPRYTDFQIFYSSGLQGVESIISMNDVNADFIDPTCLHF